MTIEIVMHCLVIASYAAFFGMPLIVCGIVAYYTIKSCRKVYKELVVEVMKDRAANKAIADEKLENYKKMLESQKIELDSYIEKIRKKVV